MVISFIALNLDGVSETICSSRFSLNMNVNLFFSFSKCIHTF